MTARDPSRRPWYRRASRLVPLCALVVVAGLVGASLVSPWPAAMLIRALFEKGARDTVAEMSTYEPESGIRETLDVSYGDAGDATTLDVFSPEDRDGEVLPTVVWIHGGAWISGFKEDVRPYVRMLAAEGYTTVSLNYSLGPESRYPTAVGQLNDALAFLVEHADEHGIDPSRIVIAGDSAGANLTSQLAALTTNPDYAAELGIRPSLTPSQLRGVLLNCGIYDVSGIPNAPGIGGWGFRVALWAYLGDRDWSQSAGDRQMSTIDWVTADFPATWISGGNDDPLTPNQSRRLAERLDGLGVDVTPVFYPDDHEPALPHEYQFHLDLEDARTAFASTVAFLDRVTD
ncbi:alpha/beta hydrolase [Microbacterium marinilacus]|uniref:Alpha/beta hydrolase n=1 Tax=Microbacterium marinilacus TaxID=415209 RepID=A0ABP7B1U2_9MICO|nr:alpha/beta hydrolase [Microbacterium marinilacus]MBY0690111.1 alpha/beta hydrolase [Microbacterium marinilacus]